MELMRVLHVKTAELLFTRPRDDRLNVREALHHDGRSFLINEIGYDGETQLIWVTPYSDKQE